MQLVMNVRRTAVRLGRGLQVASLQQEHPALVACYFMSYLQEDASLAGGAAPQPPAQPPSGQPSQTGSPGEEVLARALPSTRAGAEVLLQGGGNADARVVSVPRIVFLYRLAAGVADRSFGAPPRFGLTR